MNKMKWKTWGLKKWKKEKEMKNMIKKKKVNNGLQSQQPTPITWAAIYIPDFDTD